MRPVSPKPAVSSPVTPLEFVRSPRSWLYAFWKFSRPHTIIGTSLSVVSLAAIATFDRPHFILHWPTNAGLVTITAILPVLLACLCGNVYIVGLNQLEDVEIDRINKPHLPIASGEFSRPQSWRMVVCLGLLAVAIAAVQSLYLLAMVGCSLLIGTAYSLPPIRLKRFPFWASFCILAVRGVIVNLGLFLHFHPGGPIPPHVWALTLFILVFSIAIAIFKDMPDAEGDRQYQIATFTLAWGQQPVFNLARGLITSCYLGLILLAVLGLPGVNQPWLVTSQSLILLAFWWRSRRVDLHHQLAISRFYQFIWKLFFLQYILFPILCLNP